MILINLMKELCSCSEIIISYFTDNFGGNEIEEEKK